MSEAEQALNRNDLNAYITGDYTLSAMVPGIRPTHSDSGKKLPGYGSRNSMVESSGGKSLLSLDFLEKQKRLQQYGYSKE